MIRFISILKVLNIIKSIAQNYINYKREAFDLAAFLWSPQEVIDRENNESCFQRFIKLKTENWFDYKSAL